jgi:nucleotide-binding universal stress UspA family protein
MAPYVKRAAALARAKVSLIHVFDPSSYNGFEMYMRTEREISVEHEEIARDRLGRFLQNDFPSEQPRILVSGDAATKIAEAASHGFDLIIMPTHAGTFRRMLLGSTTAKVLNDSDCPVLTSQHAETIAPRPLDHRQWLCAIGLDVHSERVLRFAAAAAAQAGANVSILHAIQGDDPGVKVRLDLQEKVRSEERQQARKRIAEMQQKAGFAAAVEVVIGPVKEALLEGIRRFDADVLVIGRGAQSARFGKLRDLTYAIVRDSPFPVLSV